MRIWAPLGLLNKSEAGLGHLFNLQHKIKHKEQASGGGIGGCWWATWEGGQTPHYCN